MNLKTIKQALNSNYTKELATTSLQEYKRVSRVIIPTYRGMNQSQDECMPITGRIPNGQYTTDFLPRFMCCNTLGVSLA